MENPFNEAEERSMHFWAEHFEECAACVQKRSEKIEIENARNEADSKRRAIKRWQEIGPKIGSRLAQNLQETHPGFDAAALAAAREWEPFYEGESINLVIQGPPGVGKTRIAASLCERETINGQYICEWITESQFFELVGDLGRPAKREAAEDRIEELTECDVLFFDDLGSGALTEPRLSRLFSLVNERYKKSYAPSAWTTNRTVAELTDRIARFWRVQGHSDAEAQDEADRLLRRIYGYAESPLAKVIGCGQPTVEGAGAA